MNDLIKLSLSVLAIALSCSSLLSCKTSASNSEMLADDASSSQAEAQPLESSKKKMILMNFQRQQSQ